MGKYDELKSRMRSRAAFCRGRMEIKTPELLEDGIAAITTLEAELEKLRPQVKVADDQWDAKCDELAAMKARGDRLAEALITLSELSSYLGAGAGDDTTTVEQFNQRIRWGIDHIGSSYRNRAAQVVEECSKKFGTTWGQVKRAILEDTCLEPATLIRDEARGPEIEEAADRITTLEAELAAMKARGDRMAEAGKNLLSACYEADGYEELPEQIDGSLLDAMSLAIWPEIWTDEQVAALNAYQARDDSHPFTCGSDNRGDEAHRAVQDEDGGDLGQLVATRQGWICPACDYRQFWAHDFMLAQALTEWRDQHHGGNDADT